MNETTTPQPQNQALGLYAMGGGAATKDAMDSFERNMQAYFVNPGNWPHHVKPQSSGTTQQSQPHPQLLTPESPKKQKPSQPEVIVIDDDYEEEVDQTRFYTKVCRFCVNLKLSFSWCQRACHRSPILLDLTLAAMQTQKYFDMKESVDEIKEMVEKYCLSKLDMKWDAIAAIEDTSHWSTSIPTESYAKEDAVADYIFRRIVYCQGLHTAVASVSLVRTGTIRLLDMETAAEFARQHFKEGSKEAILNVLKHQVSDKWKDSSYKPTPPATWASIEEKLRDIYERHKDTSIYKDAETLVQALDKDQPNDPKTVTEWCIDIKRAVAAKHGILITMEQVVDAANKLLDLDFQFTKKMLSNRLQLHSVWSVIATARDGQFSLDTSLIDAKVSALADRVMNEFVPVKRPALDQPFKRSVKMKPGRPPLYDNLIKWCIDVKRAVMLQNYKELDPKSAVAAAKDHFKDSDSNFNVERLLCRCPSLCGFSWASVGSQLDLSCKKDRIAPEVWECAKDVYQKYMLPRNNPPETSDVEEGEIRIQPAVTTTPIPASAPPIACAVSPPPLPVFTSEEATPTEQAMFDSITCHLKNDSKRLAQFTHNWIFKMSSEQKGQVYRFLVKNPDSAKDFFDVLLA